MALPPLYKYLDVKGAKLTLGNKTFRHAKPSDFKDVEDMTIRSIFPEDVDTALNRLSLNFTDVILNHINDAPTCSPKMAATILQLQAMFRAKPEAAAAVAAEIKKGAFSQIFSADAMKTRAEAFVTETNEFLQSYRVLCVTTNRDSEKMWSEYADKHKGIALRIEANEQKASKFELFRPVNYSETRPSLYDDTLEFLERCWFGDQQQQTKDILAKIIYSKTLGWKEECEYRLAIALGEDEEPYETLPYHPEEITEMYLGLAMDEKDKAEIVAAATAVNKDITIFQTERDAHGMLVFKH